MTRFLYIADNHWGADPVGYHQQQACPEKLLKILSVLSEYLSASGGADFILHGGDMIDFTTDEHIRTVADAFSLAVPVYLCLGNHDLTTPDAAARWLELAPQFFINGMPDYTITTAHCVIHVAPNQWGDRLLYWKDTQNPHFSPAQAERLSRALGRKSDLPHILLTHSPVYGLPVAQTGFSEPYHDPGPSFHKDMAILTKRHRNLKCVLGAHNHMNMRIHHDGTEFVTVSALCEAPFECKLFEVTSQSMKMSTISLGPIPGLDCAYNAARAFVQGRGVDRSFCNAFEVQQE